MLLDWNSLYLRHTKCEGTHSLYHSACSSLFEYPFVCSLCRDLLFLYESAGCHAFLGFTGVIPELSEREKFCNNFRISGWSFGPNFGFPYTVYTFSLLPQLKIGRSQPA